MNRLWARVRGKTDPFSKVGQENDREQAGGEYVWALQDINLEIEQGQILGIIGRNGAGKSTLLKLLSRVTAPTTGRIVANGRMASLLEVGTGFHPELTGRENIFLNGAILGMTRPEIKKQFDDIVDFSGCNKYIDTPVKRYSSGMYVRLAFAVAAHLEPEILIVDEVLAVGDADFQSRCIGKMEDVSKNSGRTILFVSHNMATVKQLCPKSVLMEKGRIAKIDNSTDVVSAYLQGQVVADRIRTWGGDNVALSAEIELHEIAILDERGLLESALSTDSEIQIRISYTVLQPIHNLRVALLITTGDGTEVFSSSDLMSKYPNVPRKPGCYYSTCIIPPFLLNRGVYVAFVDFDVACQRDILSGNSVVFQVGELAINQLGQTRAPAPSGVVHPILDWEITKKNDSPQ
ncbi:ABC transporter ATP-binding protein [Neorhodopirellula pilleata]|uniref:ABC transporter ATP-binding protein n=1 Tax=Neorhodopirellula pilleata TaxID=2714738 RepID=UPI001E2A81A0|nr:ABC transporter ATP-binding protein [Neorhodopirellula pilleata]